MKITDLVPQKKKPTRLNVFVDNVFAFGVSAELVFKNKLKVGQDIAENQSKEIIHQDLANRLMEKAGKFLAFRPRSVKETRDHLLFKGKLKELSEEEKAAYTKALEAAIERLSELEYLNDFNFAKWWISQREEFKRASKRVIQNELLFKGISKDVISELLSEGRSEEEKAVFLAEKKARSMRNLSGKDFRNKLGQYLARAGFDWEIIKKVVDRESQSK